MERRIDPTDGMAYTREEFFEYYYASLAHAYWAHNMAAYSRAHHAVQFYWESCALAPPEPLLSTGASVQTSAALEPRAAEAASALADGPVAPRPEEDCAGGLPGLSTWQLAVHSAVHSDEVQRIVQRYDAVEESGDAPALRQIREALIEACVEAMPPERVTGHGKHTPPMLFDIVGTALGRKQESCLRSWIGKVFYHSPYCLPRPKNGRRSVRRPRQSRRANDRHSSVRVLSSMGEVRSLTIQDHHSASASCAA